MIHEDDRMIETCCKLPNVLNYNFSKEQYMFHEDDRMIETCSKLLSVFKL